MTTPTTTTSARDLRIAGRFIPSGARCVLEHTNGSAAYVYEAAGAFYALAFSGSAGRTCFNYRYRTAAQRDAAVWNFKLSVEASLTRKATVAAENAAWTNPLKAGDVLYASWGYDQTNVDFYAVTRVSGRRTYLRPIAAETEATGSMVGRTWPAMPVRVTGPETMHVARPAGAGVTIRVGHQCASLVEAGRKYHTSSYA